jgi:hypothetical protein
MTPDEWINLIRFRLDCLPRENGHHTFEKLCMAFARRRIASNLLPASGPVSAGGDQGRDFETFTTYVVANARGTQYERQVTGDVICFACTTESPRRLKGKIREDIEKIMCPPVDRAGPLPDRIFIFTVADLAVALRHKLQAWAQEQHHVHVEIIDGSALAHGLAASEMVDAVVAHLSVPRSLAPARSLMSMLTEVDERLADVSSDFAVELHAGSDWKGLSVKPLQADQSVQPEFTILLDFPKTKGGRAAERDFNEHLRTGAPVIIPMDYVVEIGLPEPLKSVLGFDRSLFGGIGLPPLGAGQSFLCDAVAEADGQLQTVSGVELLVIQAGSEQITFSNAHQSRVPRFDVIVNRLRESFTLSVQFGEEINVKQQLEAARFQNLAATGAMIKLVQTETGMPLVGGVVPEGLWEKPGDLFMELLEKLFEIQKKTGLLFSAPRICTIEDARDVFRIAQIVTTGESHASKITFQMVTEGVKATLKALNQDVARTGTFFLAGSEFTSVELFGRAIELGRSVITANEVFLNSEDRDRLEAAAQSQDPAEVHEIVLRPPADRPAVVRYEKWVPASVREVYFNEKWLRPSLNA